MKKGDQKVFLNTAWIVIVSIFLFIVVDSSLEKMSGETFIKNSATEKVLKSESKNKVKYKVEDGEGNYKYSWTFNKTKEIDDDIEDYVNLSIDTNVINSKIGLVFTF